MRLRFVIIDVPLYTKALVDAFHEQSFEVDDCERHTTAVHST